MNLSLLHSKFCGDYTLWYYSDLDGYEGPNDRGNIQFEVRDLYYVETPEGDFFEDAAEWDAYAGDEFPHWDSLMEEVYG